MEFMAADYVQGLYHGPLIAPAGQFIEYRCGGRQIHRLLFHFVPHDPGIVGPDNFVAGKTLFQSGVDVPVDLPRTGRAAECGNNNGMFHD
jgi:hypothetical protein